MLHQVEVVADVGGVLKGNPVGDGTLGNGGTKPVCMADNPVGHKAAVGAAGHAHAGGVDHGIGLEHDVGKLHQVVVVVGAVMAPDVGKGVALSVGAARIAVEDEVAGVGPHLHLVVVELAEQGARTAVNMQNGGVGLSLFKPGGPEGPAVDFKAVGIGKAVVLGGDYAVIPQQPVVEVYSLNHQME